MDALVALILIGALGFAFGRFLFLRPRPGSWYERFMLSGAEFLVIGAVIGPSGVEILDRSTLSHLEPFLILALSWIGLLIGIQLRWRHLLRFPWAYFQVAGIQALVSLGVVLAGLGLLFWLWTPTAAESAHRWRAALCLAAVATLSSPTEAVRHEGLQAHGGHVAGLLRFVPAIDPLVALAGIGVLFSLWHGGEAVFGIRLGAGQWILASAGGGLVLGALFLLLLWSTGDSDELTLVVLGMALFSGGLASVFQLSPLVVCLVEGLVLSNWRVHEDRLLHMFLRLERPLYIILLVLAGAMWRFEDLWGYALAAAFILLKFGAKFLGTRTAIAVTPLPFSVPDRFWMGLVPQGAMAIAIAVSYRVVYEDGMAEIVFAAALVSTVVFTLVSRNLISQALGFAKKGSP
jgi:Kef-type K+ transport system membrane component KefB